ncbi:MAG: zinc ribbon domain-containing protein [Treponema sp.]|jgi:hypothetical protein|nr:zinc ribbon domain-containing protein [Treponema sp.]
MNANLLAIVKQIVAEQGENILSEPRRVTAFFADLAKDEPKAQKYAFVKCLEHKSAQLLKNAAEPDREACKQQLAQKMYDEEGLDPGLCKETIELLAAVLFGEEKKKSYCKNCGKELQEEWKSCPYCSVSAAKTSQVSDPAISTGSGIEEDGIEQIKPIAAKKPAAPSTTPTYTNNTADQNTGALTGGQWFFVLLVAVGVAVIASVIKYDFVNINTILNNWWFGLMGGYIMYLIFIGANTSKKKKP